MTAITGINKQPTNSPLETDDSNKKWNASKATAIALETIGNVSYILSAYGLMEGIGTLFGYPYQAEDIPFGGGFLRNAYQYLNGKPEMPLKYVDLFKGSIASLFFGKVFHVAGDRIREIDAQIKKNPTLTESI